MFLPVAHASHWLLWAIYAVPLLVVAVAIIRSAVEQRRERKD